MSRMRIVGAALKRLRSWWLPAGVGLVVGAVFLSFTAHQVRSQYAGNVSGLLLISHHFFDRSPMAREHPDLAPTLHFADGVGYDGQFFYFMTFDPFMLFSERPRFRAFIDAPPYRYGRIGFSLLTKVLSGDRPQRYPITMVALVLGSLAICGALLGAIAQHHGRRAWYGLLIVCVPGFWQSVGFTTPEPLAVACYLAAYLCLIKEKWWAAGALLGLSLLVRETGGALVLAVSAGLLFSGRRREGLVVTLLAFVPIVTWKGLVGWALWAEYGVAGMMPHPDDLGLPFAGAWRVWQSVARDTYFTGWWDMKRAAIAFPIVTTAAAALALVAVIRRPGPIAIAAAVYAVVTITFNYEAVWLHIGNAQRLTTELFVALALLTVIQPPGQRLLSRAFALFWCAAAWYVFFGTFQAAVIRDGLAAPILGAF